MRILQVITLCELGGAQSVVVNLANSLCGEHEVIVAAGEGDGKMWPMLHPSIKQEQLQHLQREISAKEDVLAAIELRKLYKKYKPDAIHLHSSKAGLLGRLVFPSKKVVYTVHGFDSIRLAYRKLLPIERFMQHFCHAIVGVSDYDKRNLLAEKVKHNVCAIPNGILTPDTSNMQPLPVFASEKKTVLCIARVFPPKKPELFVEVAKLLPQYEFVWIGNQREETEFKLSDNCHFLGNIPNAGAYCSQADMFVLTSNYEGLPMVIIEAMSFGKPVVSSDVGGICEIVRNGENGYVLPNDARQFADKINEILENDGTQAMFGNKSKEIFEKELTVNKMRDGYLTLYESMKHSC